MEEQRISIETAKVLKDVGFTDYCKYSYLDNILTSHTPGHQELDGRIEDYLEHNIFYAPTQSCLQKWIIKKYNIYPLIEETFTFATITKIGFYARVISPNLDIEPPLEQLYYSNVFYGTIDEALEDALYNALLSIKQLNNKNNKNKKQNGKNL